MLPATTKRRQNDHKTNRHQEEKNQLFVVISVFPKSTQTLWPKQHSCSLIVHCSTFSLITAQIHHDIVSNSDTIITLGLLQHTREENKMDGQYGLIRAHSLFQLVQSFRSLANRSLLFRLASGFLMVTQLFGVSPASSFRSFRNVEMLVLSLLNIALSSIAFSPTSSFKIFSGCLRKEKLLIVSVSVKVGS